MKNIMDSKTLKPLRLYTHTHTHISNALKENKRIKYIDIARGITIILMIIGHVLETGWKRSVIFSFHMPLFIIISGLFYREKSLKENIKNIFLKLMLPYIITTLVVKICLYNHTQSILYCLKDWINQIVFSYSYWGRVQFAPEVERLSILWFFPLLAIIRLMFFFLKKCSKDNSIRLFFLCITVTYLGYLLGKTGYWLPFSIDVAMLSTIFYYIGYLLNQKHILEKILLDGKSLILIMFIWLLGVKYNWIELAGRNYPNGAFSILTAVCGTLVILKLSQLIEKYLKNIGNVLSWYGQNSMKILILHYIESQIINYNQIFTSNSTLFKGRLIALKLSIVTGGTLVINTVKKVKGYFINNRKTYKKSCLKKQKKV